MKKVKYLIAFCFCFGVALMQAQTDTTANDEETDTFRLSSQTLPVFTTGSSDASNANAGQDVISFLGASRDPFVQSVGFHFYMARFRYRGYNTDNMTVMVNNIRVNDLDNGQAGWSNWGGMNDVIRFMDIKTGLGASRSTFGDVGGFYNLTVNASSFRKGVRVTYSRGNRIFKDRVTITASTGLLKSGWAFSLSATMREATKAYVPGTSYLGFGLFFGADKHINEKNTLSFISFAAPAQQDRSSYETDEAFALTNNGANRNFWQNMADGFTGQNTANNHYNSYWGYQDGKIRNSRVSTVYKPTFILSDIHKFDNDAKLTTSGFYSFGRSSLTGLNYYDAPNPTPDYYYYMPSYYGPTSTNSNPFMYQTMTNAWQNNTNYTQQTNWDAISNQNGIQQVNWDMMINANRTNPYIVHNVDGDSTKTFTGNRAKYILQESRQDVQTGGFNAILNAKTKQDIYLTGGLNTTIENTRYYMVVNDLLGADYWLDWNQFANQLSPNPMVMQNNINDPNKLIKKGDVFGYDYNINTYREEVWGQAEKNYKWVDIYASMTLNNTSFYRNGHMVNGLFPYTAGQSDVPEGASTSGGKSKTLDFLNYGFKVGATFKIDGHNFVTVNGAYITKPPLPTNSFVSPRTRNDEIPNIGSEHILSGDITYRVRFPWLKGRITYYYSQINNQVWERSYYDDVFKTNVNYFMTGLNQLNQGLELGLEGTVFKHVSIIGALALGDYRYTNEPNATISADNTATLLAQNRKIYIKSFHVGGSPQTAASIGFKYNSNSKNNWHIGIYYNYFANNYVTINPDRRTAEALTKYVSSDPQVSKIVTQEKLPSAYTIDFMAGKSIRFGNKYFLSLTLMINNLTNNVFKNYGMEQLRHDVNNIDKFPNKYGYSLGLTYMLSVAFSFN